MKGLDLTKDIIKYLNKDFINENNLYLIGGTTISLLNEDYRVSEDLDFYFYEPERNLDYKNILLDNEKYVIEEEPEETHYSVKIKIKVKEENKTYKLELVKFEKKLEEDVLIKKEENIDLKKIEEGDLKDFFSLSFENLTYLKLFSLYDRGAVFPHKDFFDLLILKENLNKDFKDIPNVDYCLNKITKNNSYKFGNVFLDLCSNFIKYPEKLELSKRALCINKEIDLVDVVELFVQYIEYEKNKHINLNRQKEIESLELFLEENNIDIKAGQKRRLGLKPNETELLEEEIANILYEHNASTKKKDFKKTI